VVTTDSRPSDDELVDGGGDDGGVDDDGDVVVLSWWQNPINIITMLVGTALIAGMIGWLIADTAAEPDANDVDVGFLQDMRDHHDQAIQMSLIYLTRPDTAPGLRTVARSVLVGQGVDVGRMIQLLRDLDAPEAAESEEAMAWMGMPTPRDQMPGMASEEQLQELGAANGADADRLFVELMTAHHQGGIHMAEFAATEAENEEVREMAASLADSQADEIIELQRELE
jgi:uncharacterized protein (DUF305 family)